LGFFDFLAVFSRAKAFRNYIEHQLSRARNGEHQTHETLINEEALLFAKFLRDELQKWTPRQGIVGNGLISSD
jgi:hypothetical protein